jgi:hypothetical protein
MKHRDALKERLAIRFWAYSVLSLVRSLDANLPPEWPEWPAADLASIVSIMIVEEPYLAQYLGSILSDLNRVIEAAPVVTPFNRDQLYDPARWFPAPTLAPQPSGPPFPLPGAAPMEEVA